MSLRARSFAMTYDRQMAKTERAQLRDLRHGLLASAAGEVIEVGGGTGANLSCYGPEVTSLTITEPEPPMVRRLERRAREPAPLAKILRAPAEDLPFRATPTRWPRSERTARPSCCEAPAARTCTRWRGRGRSRPAS